MNDAQISECGQYRYTLTRELETELLQDQRLLFVMLNPSTADASEDDATIRRCKTFARNWGFGGFTVVNLYAFRATDPEDLFKAEDPVGPENNVLLVREIFAAEMIVCAWGGNAKPDRVNEFMDLAWNYNLQLKCLHINADGSPKHPLYCKATLHPIPYKVEYCFDCARLLRQPDRFCSHCKTIPPCK